VDRAQGDVDESLYLQPELSWIDLGPIAVNDSGTLELPYTLPARCLRKAHLRPQLREGLARIFFQ